MLRCIGEENRARSRRLRSVQLQEVGHEWILRGRSARLTGHLEEAGKHLVQVRLFGREVAGTLVAALPILDIQR